MGVLNYLGVVLTLALIVGVSALSGRKVKTAADFATGGGRSGSWMICAAIMGALVGSQATIGTAQLAFTYGVAAWWFTLGAGIGCLILALGYAKPLKRTGETTIMAVIGKEYGHTVKYIGSVLSSIGIFISVLAQVVACMSLLTVIFSVSIPAAAAIAVILMAAYVIFGGSRGVGMGGIVKLILLYASCIVGIVVVFSQKDGLSGVVDQVRTMLMTVIPTDMGGLTDAADLTGRYGSLIARGAVKDIGSGVSLVLGVLSTQTYAQAIWSAESDRAAKRGSLMAAVLIPPIGVAGILIGMFMRGRYVTQAEVTALLAAGKTVPEGVGIIASTIQVFPAFVVNHMPTLIAGIVLGTLLITVLAAGAGLSLGVATICVNDILKRLSRRFDHAKASLKATRFFILCALIAAALIACLVPSATINDFGFLSMGLRGTVVFLPLTCAMFWPGRFRQRFTLLSIIGGVIGVLAAKFLKCPTDPLFIGMAVAAIFIILGINPKRGTVEKN